MAADRRVADVCAGDQGVAAERRNGERRSYRAERLGELSQFPYVAPSATVAASPAARTAAAWTVRAGADCDDGTTQHASHREDGRERRHGRSRLFSYLRTEGVKRTEDGCTRCSRVDPKPLTDLGIVHRLDDPQLERVTLLVRKRLQRVTQRIELGRRLEPEARRLLDIVAAVGALRESLACR